MPKCCSKKHLKEYEYCCRILFTRFEKAVLLYILFAYNIFRALFSLWEIVGVTGRLSINVKNKISFSEHEALEQKKSTFRLFSNFLPASAAKANITRWSIRQWVHRDVLNLFPRIDSLPICDTLSSRNSSLSTSECHHAVTRKINGIMIHTFEHLAAITAFRFLSGCSSRIRSSIGFFD